jgi:hypothetical protein
MVLMVTANLAVRQIKAGPSGIELAPQLRGKIVGFSGTQPIVKFLKYGDRHVERVPPVQFGASQVLAAAFFRS